MSDWISTDDQGDHGQPGSKFYKCFAGVRRAKNGNYELHVQNVRGSNQGYLEEHYREERKFRHDELADLMQIGLSEIESDEDFRDHLGKFKQAIRNAIYEAQDSEEE